MVGRVITMMLGVGAVLAALATAAADGSAMCAEPRPFGGRGALVRCTTAATPTVAELTGGVTPGFSANSDPDGITTGPGGHIWFTEFSGPGGSGFDFVGPGGVGRVNDDGTVTELVGGKTPGFSRSGGPEGITSGPGDRIWFAMYLDPGRLGEVINGQVSEFTAGVRAGFSADSGPGSIPGSITTGADGHIWFTAYADPGRLGEVVNGTVRELTGGVTSGFSANRKPLGIAVGPDGHIWFTEQNNPGGVGRVNGDGTVTELTGGVTPGFSKDARPFGITTGPDGHIWFTEYNGGVGRANDDGTVTELTAGVTSGFSKHSQPEGITPGPDGHLWFTEYNSPSPGRVARINDDGSVSEFTAGVTPGFSVDAGPSGITSGPDGRIWFTEYDRSGIGRITVGPRVITGAASKVGADSATLSGTVRPNGQQTVYHFQYGPTSAYGSESPLTSAGTGAAARAVSAALSGLKPGTLYHYRLLATNDTDTTAGKDRTFTTTAAADTQAPSAPLHLSGRFAAGALRLSWGPATDNIGVDHYQLSRDGRPVQRIAGHARCISLSGFHTARRTTFSLRAFDAAGNRSVASNRVTVIPVRRPAGVPRVVPGWARKLLAWQTSGHHRKRPPAPAKLPAWYARWKAWQLHLYTVTGGR